MKNKSLILGVVSAVFACNLFFTSCSSGPTEVEKFTFLEKRMLTGEDSMIDKYPRNQNGAHGGKYFSRSDSSSPYGLGTEFLVNDTMLNRDIRLNIDFWAKTNEIGEGYTYAVSTNLGDKMFLWLTLDLKKHITQPNVWTRVTDSITVPASALNQSGVIIKSFTFVSNNPKKSIVLDADDLELTYKIVKKEVQE